MDLVRVCLDWRRNKFYNIGLIKDAGFQYVKIVDETVLTPEWLTIHQQKHLKFQTFRQKSKKQAAVSISSIKVKGVKPK